MLRTSLKALKPTVPVSLLALTNYLTSRSTYRSYSLSSVSPTNESLENDLSALSLGSNAAESTNTAGTVGSKDSDSAANRKKKSPVRLAPLRVIMDIDECMVHAHMFGDDNDVDKTVRKAPNNARNYSVERKEGDDDISAEKVDSIRLMCEDNSPVHIRIRPGLKKFLEEISKINCEVYAFTAGLPVYARPVIKEIDPDGTIFKKVLYRDSCTEIRLNNSMFYSKDLKSFGTDIYDEKRTVLVDNNIFSFVINPNNGIHICEFYDAADDRELEKVLELITHLALVPDVRVPLNKIFQVDKTLTEIGIPPNSLRPIGSSRFRR